MAYYRQVGEPTPSYESCSTSAFRHGRTETMRPATDKTKLFVEQFLSSSRPSKGELRHMIKECSRRHFQLIKEASMGQGFDRHLFGLKHIAQQRGYPVPEVFTDPTYDEVSRFVISTSTLSTDTIILGGFGPVVPDGYGIAYNVSSKRLGCTVSAYKGHRDGSEFVECLGQSLSDIKGILDQ